MAVCGQNGVEGGSMVMRRWRPLESHWFHWSTLRSLLHRWLTLVCVHLSNEGAVCCLARPFVRNRQGDVWKAHSISARLHSRCSLLFSRLVTSSSLWPHGLQHARPPHHLPSPGVCSDSSPLSRWCHPTISSSNAFFSFCPWYFPPSRTFPMSLFASDDQNTGASTLVLPVNIQGWSLFRLTGWIFSLSRGLLQHHSSKASILWHSGFFTVQLSQPYVTTGNTIALMIQTFVSRVMSLLFNTLSRLVIAFLPRSNWPQSRSSDFGAQEEEICHYFHLFLFYLPSVTGLDAMILVFLIFSLKLALGAH